MMPMEPGHTSDSESFIHGTVVAFTGFVDFFIPFSRKISMLHRDSILYFQEVLLLWKIMISKKRLQK